MKYQFLVNVICLAPIEHHQLYTHHHARKVIKVTMAHHQTHGFNYNDVFKLEINRAFSMVWYFFEHFLDTFIWINTFSTQLCAHKG
jgi:hypothetical protein